MFFWFVGLSLVGVALVFSSPALDYRLVVAGSVLPLVEIPFGEPRVLHALLAPVAVLAVVMVATRGRLLLRRRLLGVPIGMFMHLFLDGIWTDTDAFWWPFVGAEFSDATIPELARGAFGLVLEVAGIGALVWARRAFGLDDAAARANLLRTGRLPRSTAPGN